MKLFNKILFFTSCIMMGFTQAKDIIFDLGYTLVKPDTMALSSEIGMADFISYSLFDGKNQDDLKVAVFDILSLISGNQTGDESLFVCADNGEPFPQILVDWQCGLVDPQEVYEVALVYARELKALGYFTSSQEYRLVCNALRIMLDPELLASHMKPIKKGIKLLKECAEQINKDGTPAHRLFILSNWDPTSFEFLKKTDVFQELLQYVQPEHIVISGDIQKIKPHRDIYDYTLKRFKIKPQECIFIDDQESNIFGAQQCGINAIHLEHKKYKELRENLHKLNVV